MEADTETSNNTDAVETTETSATDAFVNAAYERLRNAPQFVLTYNESALRTCIGDDNAAWDALRSALTDAYNHELSR